MNYSNELAQDITDYNALQTEQDKRNFLDKQRQKIAQMTPEQRKSHRAAIAREVSRMAQRVEKSRRSATA